MTKQALFGIPLAVRFCVDETEFAALVPPANGWLKGYLVAVHNGPSAGLWIGDETGVLVRVPGVGGNDFTPSVDGTYVVLNSGKIDLAQSVKDILTNALQRSDVTASAGDITNATDDSKVAGAKSVLDFVNSKFSNIPDIMDLVTVIPQDRTIIGVAGMLSDPNVTAVYTGTRVPRNGDVIVIGTYKATADSETHNSAVAYFTTTWTIIEDKGGLFSEAAIIQMLGTYTDTPTTNTLPAAMNDYINAWADSKLPGLISSAIESISSNPA
jgi:hypothetical protein